MLRGKQFFIFLGTLLLLSIFILPAIAADAGTPDKVVDGAGLLTEEEEDALRSRIAEVVSRYQCDLVIVTADSTHGKTPRAFADDYFDENGYGIGASRSGVLLLVSMEERDWYISTGGTAIRAFTEYGLDYMEERIPPLLTSGDYMEAFETFVSLCEDFLRETEENRPYDIDNKIREPKTLSDYLFYLVISVAAGAVIAFFATSSMKRKLRTAVPQPAAHAYIREDGVQITKSKDLYLFSSVSRTPRPKNTGGGGSRTHTSAGGRAHGGRGGKF